LTHEFIVVFFGNLVVLDFYSRVFNSCQAIIESVISVKSAAFVAICIE